MEITREGGGPFRLQEGLAKQGRGMDITVESLTTWYSLMKTRSIIVME
jgi:hypothetical protein